MTRYNFTLMVDDFDAWLVDSYGKKIANILKVVATGAFMITSSLYILGVLK